MVGTADCSEVAWPVAVVFSSVTAESVGLIVASVTPVGVPVDSLLCVASVTGISVADEGAESDWRDVPVVSGS